MDKIVALVISAFLFAAASAQETIWTGTTFPNPKVDFDRCGMPSPTYLCDPDSLLTQQQRLEVQKTVEEVEQSKKKFETFILKTDKLVDL